MSKGTRYAELMTTRFRHSFFNRDGDACTDLDVTPTARTTKLMSSLGLLFRAEAAGFSVLYDTSRSEALVSFLRRQGEDVREAGIEFWSRLSFVLTSRNPHLVDVTDIAIDLDPTSRNLYFTNQSSHVTADGEVLLHPGSRVRDKDLLPTVPSSHSVQVDDDVDAVVVRAISGEAVIRHQRPPVDAALRPPERGGRPPNGDPLGAGGGRGESVVQLDFSTLPHDKYSIERVKTTGSTSRPCLYTRAVPTPLGFVDLLFSRPTPLAEGSYPVHDLADVGRTTIKPTAYVLKFEARATVWNYYIVPQARPGAFDRLGIECLPQGAQTSFVGPCRVALPTGAEAYRFMSERPMRLHQRSPFQLRLRGSRSDRSEDEVLVDRLPVAGDQVRPLTSAMLRLSLAQTLCPDGNDGIGCTSLIRHVFGPRTAAAAARDGFSRLSADRATAARPSLPEAPAPCRGHSDLYVYV